MRRFIVLVALLGCGSKTEDKPPAPKAERAGSADAAPDGPEIVAATPAGTPFFIEIAGDKKPTQYPVACLMTITPPFVVMAPSSKKAKGPCDVTGENDFAFSLEFFPCGKDVQGACALPEPGTKLKGRLRVSHFTGEVDVIVVTKEKPHLTVRVDRPNGDSGDLQILIDDGHPRIDRASWK